jgi:hypothetical protein
MDNSTRMPEYFTEHGDIDMMSNFDGSIIYEIASDIEGNEMFSRYAGRNFNGKVWWEENKWLCEVWTYGSWSKTLVFDALDEMMIGVSSEYGHE